VTIILRLILLTMLLLFSASSYAASYSLPADFGSGAFSNCSGSGTVYSCTGEVTLKNNDSVILTGDVTLNISGELVIGNGISLDNNGFVFEINVDGEVNIGSNAIITADLTATSEINIKNNAIFTGNISSSDSINIGNNGVFTGDITAANELNIGANTVVNGICTPFHPQCTGGGSPPLDHFRITPATLSASTCLPNAITIIAEDSANNPVIDYINQIDITTSTNNGNWSINNADNTLTPVVDNNDDGAVNYTFVITDAGEIVLDLSNTHAETLTITVSDPVAGISSTSVAITFSRNIFIITEDPIQIAGRPQAMTIAMWTDDTAGSGNCGIDSGYNSNTQILEASIDRAGVLATAADPSIGAVTIPDGPATASLTLDFSLTPGQASFNLDTTDVGQYALTLEDTTLVYSDTVITGTSAVLTVEPFGLAVTNIVAGATVNPGANTPAGAIFTTAGLNFSATVASVLWDAADDTDNDGVLDTGVYYDNAVAPSYAWDTTLSVSPAGFTPATGVPGTLNNGAILAAEFAVGSVTIIDLQYTEVGSFTLLTQAFDFLGDLAADIVGDPIIIGRFIPAFFQLMVTNNGALENTCLVYTYIGEDFGYSTPPAFTVSAMNALAIPTVTQNYRDGYVKLNASSITVDVSTDTSVVGTDLMPLNVSFTSAPMIFTANNDGTVDYTFGADNIRYGPDSVLLDYSKEANSEIIPFTGDLDPVLTQVSDGEVTTAFAVAFDLIGNQLRFGRIRMNNVFGSELIDLAMPMFIEYLEPSGIYVINTDDNCTTVADSDLVIIDNLSVPGSSTVTVTNPTAIGGDLGVTLTAPGAGIDGDINVSPDLVLSLDKWLRYDWNNTGQFDADPNATATFGIYSGNPVNIYIQQIYQ